MTIGIRLPSITINCINLREKKPSKRNFLIKHNYASFCSNKWMWYQIIDQLKYRVIGTTWLSYKCKSMKKTELLLRRGKRRRPISKTSIRSGVHSNNRPYHNGKVNESNNMITTMKS